MFSLIITIISIALVAALALATLYYGGVAFQRGAASADATKLHTQAQQLQGAAELYKADTGAYPLTLAALVSADYLKSIPVSHLMPDAVPTLLNQAMAAGVAWKMVLSGYPVFAVESVTPAVCEAVNLKAYGTSGILKSARSLYATQCFGSDLANLTMVTAKSGDALMTVAGSSSATVALGTVLTTAPPAASSGDTTAAGWLSVEGVTAATVTPPPAALPGIDQFNVQSTTRPSGANYSPIIALSSEAWPTDSNINYTALSGGIWFYGDVGDSDVVSVTATNTSGNTGPLQVNFGPTVFGASQPIAFAFTQTNDCNRDIAPGGTCTIQVTYAPTQADPGYSAQKKLDFSNASGGYAGGSKTNATSVYYSAKVFVWSGAAGSTPNLNGSHQLAFSLHHYPAPAVVPFKVQISSTIGSNPTYSFVSMDGTTLAGLSNTGYGNGYAVVRVGPGLTVNESGSSFFWDIFSIADPLVGSTGSFSVNPRNGDPEPSAAVLSGWNTVVSLNDPYIYDTGSAVMLPATGAAPRIWCATYPQKAPGDTTKKVGTAVLGACL